LHIITGFSMSFAIFVRRNVGVISENIYFECYVKHP
jgi:hypothetical protein